MNATSLTDRKNAAISRGVGMTTQIYADRAENAEIWTRKAAATSISPPASPFSILATAIPA